MIYLIPGTGRTRDYRETYYEDLSKIHEPHSQYGSHVDHMTSMSQCATFTDQSTIWSTNRWDSRFTPCNIDLSDRRLLPMFEYDDFPSLGYNMASGLG